MVKRPSDKARSDAEPKIDPSRWERFVVKPGDVQIIEPGRGGQGSAQAAENSPAEPPLYALPGDLPAALKHLRDDQLAELQRQIAAEVERRAAATGQPPSTKPVRPKRQAASEQAVSLSSGQVNLIHAAVNAGVKSATIARELGLPLSTVQRVLRR